MPFNKYLNLLGLLIAFYAFAGIAVASGEEVETLPRLKPLNEVNILLSRDEPYDLDTFIDAALIFSGTKYNNIYIGKSRILKEVAAFREFMGAAASEGTASAAAADTTLSPTGNPVDTPAVSAPSLAGNSPAAAATVFTSVDNPAVPTTALTPDTAEKVLEYLHKHILRAYSEKQTKIDVLFNTGIYNCVSSAVAYMILAKSIGFTVKGVRTKDHAFCTVYAGGKGYDVETTSPYGFDPGEKKDFTDAFGRTTGYSYVPPGNYRDRNTINEKEMLALILYNRNAFLTERRDFFNAVGPAVDAYALLNNAESLERLAVSLNNTASAYGLRGEMKRGIDFLKRAESVYINKLIRDKLNENILKLYHNYVIELIKRKDFSAALTVLNNSLKENYISRPEWKNLTVYVYQVMARETSLGRSVADAKAISRLDSDSVYLRAAEIIEKGLKAVGRDRSLLRNYEVYMHNAAVEKIKLKDYRTAERIVKAGLRVIPESSVLARDETFIKRAAGQ